jgi:hypothetical protein
MADRLARQVEQRARRIRDPVKRLRFLRETAGLQPPQPRRPRPLPVRALALAALWVALPGRIAERPGLLARPFAPARVETQPADVWACERNREYDLYSNGLRIENEFATGGPTRRYAAFPRSAPRDPVWRTEPAGIVFHGSEGDVAPFDAEHNGELHRQGRALLEYVRRRGLYHFVIDRFGRVYRVVAETAPASHAGHSVWADDRWIYLNLNSSFLGVCFEGHGREGGASAAQVHAGKVLAEMLRARYRIPAHNCVGHAAVSVNPANFLIGYHTDWASGLPFAELSLPDNYLQPLPALYLFGFAADSYFVGQAGGGLRRGLESAGELVRNAAATRRESVPRYRDGLRDSYREMIAMLRRPGAR